MEAWIFRLALRYPIGYPHWERDIFLTPPSNEVWAIYWSTNDSAEVGNFGLRALWRCKAGLVRLEQFQRT
jgi:hypothetical protein